MEQLEIEVKFHLTDAAGARERIIRLGAESTGRVFETNIRFEDTAKTLIENKSLLRLRWDTRTTLTFKSEPAVKDDQFKIHRELEIEVGDFSTMRRILAAIGFHEEQTYEKWREVLLLGGTHVCVDTLPFGDFLEIEGEAEDIRNVSSAIGLSWERRILLNYLELFDIIRDKFALPFIDITFDNFKDTRIDLSDFIHIFEAGTP